MADLDLTEAIEAAARAHWTRPDRLPWEQMAPSFRHSVRESVLDEVSAAAPLIAAQVRAQMVADLAEHVHGGHVADWNCAVAIVRGVS